MFSPQAFHFARAILSGAGRLLKFFPPSNLAVYSELERRPMKFDGGGSSNQPAPLSIKGVLENIIIGFIE